MKKIFSIGGIVIFSLMLLFGCSSEEENVIKNLTLTEEEQIAFAENFLSKAQNKEEPSVLIKDLNDHIAGLDEEKASNSVDALLYSIYQYKDSMGMMLQGMQPILKDYEQLEIDFQNEEDFEKIDDSVVREFLKQAKQRLLYVSEIHGEYVLFVDFDYILDLYDSYLKDDIKEMIIFSRDEQNVPYYNVEEGKLNLDVVVDRIIRMENLLEKYPDSYYADWFTQSANFYMQHYFGLNHVSIADNSQNLLSEFEEHYKKTVKEHPESELAKKINQFFEEYEKNNNKINDNMMVFLMDLTKLEHEVYVSDGEESGELEDKNSELKEAIKDAIKEKKSSEKSFEQEEVEQE